MEFKETMVHKDHKEYKEVLTERREGREDCKESLVQLAHRDLWDLVEARVRKESMARLAHMQGLKREEEYQGLLVATVRRER